MSGLSGVLPVDKPVGPTSHDVVAVARRALRERRIGHTGTLDPFASGLLLLCVGPATRLAEYLTARPKTYVATMRLGERTDTDDRTGEVVETSDAWRALGEAAVRDALLRQIGEIRQLPPVYSAKKVGGERMYAAARRGEVLEREPVTVTVYRLQVLEVSLPEVRFEVECSAGTYIRAIARDAGETLGVGAHLTELRRTRIGEHDVSAAVSLDAIEDAERVGAAMLSPLAAVSHLPVVPVSEEEARRIASGGAVALPAGAEIAESAPAAMVSAGGELLAIGERRADRVQPRKVFA